MENPSPTIRVATAGEALMDLIAQADGSLLPCIGGAVYNLTRALAVQSVGVLYLNPLSGDRFGRDLSSGLLQAGTRLARPQPVAEPTSLAVVALDAAGKAEYAFYRDGVADRQVSAGSLWQSTQAEPDLQVVCTGCLALDPRDQPAYLPWLQRCREQGLLVVVDANLRTVVMPDLQAYRQSVLSALQQAHLIKASDDDLKALGFDQLDPVEAGIALLAQTRAHALALTLGAEGAVLLFADGRSVRGRDPVAVSMVDTVGAGDCFLAGFVSWLLSRPDHPSQNLTQLRPEDGRNALAHALASASLCVEQRGCVPPSWIDVQERVRRGISSTP